MFSTTITVFNYYESSTGAVWYPHVISGVHLETDRGQIVKKYGPDSKDSAELYVRYKSFDEDRFVIDSSGTALKWLPPKAWKKQINDDLTETITFGVDDFFMLGAWGGDDVINDDDYTDRRGEGFYAYMNAEYDFVYKISTVGGPYNVIPHFEILGA